jgi:hypothetical protein
MLTGLVDKFGFAEKGFLRRISPDLEIPYTLQTGIGIERQLTKSMVATFDYIFTRGAHLWRESNINAPVLPRGFQSFTQYLQSRDFDNRPDPAGKRPISGSSADIVRFNVSANTTSTTGALQVENGVRVLTLGLNAPRSSNITAALNAIRSLRPDPSLTQVELLNRLALVLSRRNIPVAVRDWRLGEPPSRTQLRSSSMKGPRTRIASRPV